jgi:serine/threonine-protein phosphatase 4 regulatory subunit 4
VVNIRLKFCNLLPKLKSVLKLPVDRGLLQRLEQCVRQLLSEEQDPDVSTAVREVCMRGMCLIPRKEKEYSLYPECMCTIFS